MDNQLLANAALGATCFSVAALPWMAMRGKRALAGWVVLVATADVVATLFPWLFPWLFPATFPALGNWNWSGKLLDLLAMLGLSALLVHRGMLTRTSIGLQVRQAPGSGRALLMFLTPYFLTLAALKGLTSAAGEWPSLETLAFEATMPGLAEELAYRGVLTALYDLLTRDLPNARVRILGAEMGYGALTISVAFGLLHGITFDEQLTLQCSLLTVAFTGIVGLVLAWVRARTGSLVMPVVVHNVTNLILVAMPGLH
jgi:membrane protease YdiL (CAAX protease family)